MVLRLFNTLGRQKEEFIPIDPQEVRMYACGPTVYDYPHVGNLRTFVTVDILTRFLRFKGLRVYQVMNLTDVDDKTIRGSQRRGVPLKKYTDEYTKAFFSDIDELGIAHATEYPRATEHIDAMVELISRLKEAGLAYQSDSSTYFSIAKLKSYGTLSGINVDELSSARQVIDDEYGKERAHDFALWKGWVADDGDVFWDTELGRGRPGWHIECSAMSMKSLGKSFDIHLGGVDLIFPHHENEIAQSEGSSGARFVKYWVHVEHMLVNGKKMAKSLGNYFTLGDLKKQGYEPSSVRYLLLSAHYRDQLNFTFEGLKHARESVKRLQRTFQRLESHMPGSIYDKEIAQDSNRFVKEFEDALDDDLNMPKALAALFDYLRGLNRYIDNATLSQGNRDEIVNNLKNVDSVLGIIVPSQVEISKEIRELMEDRNKARREGNWAEADRIREVLRSRGFLLEDTPAGSKLNPG